MKAEEKRFTVAAVIFPQFELLDIYGPLEMLGILPERFSITMLAEAKGEVASNQGPKGVADQSLEAKDNYDILLIPGGLGARREIENRAFINELLKKAKAAKIVATICTGSALLAKTGLLDGKRATSNKLAFDWVMSQRPNVEWVREARWVEDEKYFTSSGVSAGMDMTLGLIQKLYGRETSMEVARQAEYTWHEDKTVDPFLV